MDDYDPLAGAVLHTLVTEGSKGMDLARIAVACERDPSHAAELGEMEAALAILLGDGLALREGELFHPTRAAVRADELSF